ncbi:C2H2 type zinc-finger-domain-containing protein [Glomus cerebriforme]|uniref:C2H2 type zinc-finger-domain-containing protein n=1 Tax=Glomus cerebriforme TaxID=658196 RepID=A0A397SVT1_9GLOM|nr:C2H2 type zinc-finger-domain-containing protein [Glomus cerebriforme]
MSAATVVNQPRSQLFTCLACQIVFNNAKAQRDHYGTDWHRYNLKRKVAELPPVTSEVFNQKVLAQQAQSNDADRKASFSAECAACNKIYYSENAYANHLQSNKHKAAEAKATIEGITLTKKNSINIRGTSQVSSEGEIIDKKIEVAIALDEIDCLFCTQKFKSFDENMQHMTKVHSFFIPEIEYLIDSRGLIKYLGEKISIGNVCLYCSKGTKSLESVRKHMMDKGHCKIAYETDGDIMEVVEFYDFTSSYPDADDDDNWVFVSDDEVENDDELPKGGMVYEEDMELVLPSGKRLGHRSLRRYYKQNLRPIEEREASIINRLLTGYSDNSEYRQSGGILITNDHMYKNYQPHFVASREKKFQQDYDTRIGIKANKLQRHFRAQIM